MTVKIVLRNARVSSASDVHGISSILAPFLGALLVMDFTLLKRLFADTWGKFGASWCAWQGFVWELNLSNAALTQVSVLNQTSLGFSACTPDLSVTLVLPFWAGDIYFENCHCKNQSKDTWRFLFFSAFSNCTDLQADTQTSCDSGSPLVPSEWAKFRRESMLLRHFCDLFCSLLLYFLPFTSLKSCSQRERGRNIYKDS